MTTRSRSRSQVDVPLSTAYNQWTQFEDFPHFMGGVKEVAPARRPAAAVGRRDRRCPAASGRPRSWSRSRTRRSRGQPQPGRPTPVPSGSSRPARAPPSRLLTLEYEPEGVVEQIGDKLGIVERQVTSDLRAVQGAHRGQRATPAVRGAAPSTRASASGRPGVEHAIASQGDSGKAGVSGVAVAAGAVAAAAGRCGRRRGDEVLEAARRSSRGDGAAAARTAPRRRHGRGGRDQSADETSGARTEEHP